MGVFDPENPYKTPPSAEFMDPKRQKTHFLVSETLFGGNFELPMVVSTQKNGVLEVRDPILHPRRPKIDKSDLRNRFYRSGTRFEAIFITKTVSERVLKQF